LPLNRFRTSRKKKYLKHLTRLIVIEEISGVFIRRNVSDKMYAYDRPTNKPDQPVTRYPKHYSEVNEPNTLTAEGLENHP
jgi:hypothetical protein